MIQIRPAIDILEGKCVRLAQGLFSSAKNYFDDPVEVAFRFADAGVTHLHLVDLDGVRKKRVVNQKILETIAAKTPLRIDFGGGIYSESDLQTAFDSGAAQVTGGSVAVKQKPLFVSWLQRHGGDKMILGADVRDERVAVSGWSETTDLFVLDFLREYLECGIRYAICTDISKDGVLDGPGFDLYRKIRAQHPQLHLIASGGISSLEDVRTLEEMGVYGAIIGKALYEGKMTLAELREFLA